MSYEAKVRDAQLQVVQHGSRSSFRRRVVDALQSLVPSHAGFCFLGRGEARAAADGTRVAQDRRAGIELDPELSLSHSFGFSPSDVCATMRRAYLATELYPAAEWLAIPYFAGHSTEGVTTALL